MPAGGGRMKLDNGPNADISNSDRVGVEPRSGETAGLRQLSTLAS
jgi:hypothetical protein